MLLSTLIPIDSVIWQTQLSPAYFTISQGHSCCMCVGLAQCLGQHVVRPDLRSIAGAQYKCGGVHFRQDIYNDDCLVKYST